jgi:hypothetical protein
MISPPAVSLKTNGKAILVPVPNFPSPTKIILLATVPITTTFINNTRKEDHRRTEPPPFEFPSTPKGFVYSIFRYIDDVS